MPVRRAGAANADLRVPARLRSRTQRLPCRATRNGRRGPRASTKPSPLPAIRNAYERPVSAREPVRSYSAVSRGGAGALWRSRREAGGSCAATRGLSGRREAGTRSPTGLASPRAQGAAADRAAPPDRFADAHRALAPHVGEVAKAWRARVGRAGRRGWRGKGDVMFATAAAPGTRRPALAAPAHRTGLRHFADMRHAINWAKTQRKRGRRRPLGIVGGFGVRRECPSCRPERKP